MNNPNIQVKVNGPQALSDALRNYGTVILKPNVQDNRNVLTQDMMSKRNTKYVIQWNYDLLGETITVPEGCMIEFNGGTITNGTIVGNNTILLYDKNIDEICTANREGTFIYNTTVADEEDITSETGQLKFKDKAYNPDAYSGLAKKILRKNMVNGVNTLTQSMVSAANTIYVIQYDFILSEDITIPDNCILEFDGGSISASGNNDTITGNNTIITSNNYNVFNEVIINGSFNCIVDDRLFINADDDDKFENLLRFKGIILNNDYVINRDTVTRREGVNIMYLNGNNHTIHYASTTNNFLIKFIRPTLLYIENLNIIDDYVGTEYDVLDQYRVAGCIGGMVGPDKTSLIYKNIHSKTRGVCLGAAGNSNVNSSDFSATILNCYLESSDFCCEFYWVGNFTNMTVDGCEMLKTVDGARCAISFATVMNVSNPTDGYYCVQNSHLEGGIEWGNIENVYNNTNLKMIVTNCLLDRNGFIEGHGHSADVTLDFDTVVCNKCTFIMDSAVGHLYIRAGELILEDCMFVTKSNRHYILQANKCTVKECNIFSDLEFYVNNTELIFYNNDIHKCKINVLENATISNFDNNRFIGGGAEFIFGSSILFPAKDNTSLTKIDLSSSTATVVDGWITNGNHTITLSQEITSTTKFILDFDYQIPFISSGGNSEIDIEFNPSQKGIFLASNNRLYWVGFANISAQNIQINQKLPYSGHITMVKYSTNQIIIFVDDIPFYLLGATRTFETSTATNAVFGVKNGAKIANISYQIFG